MVSFGRLTKNPTEKSPSVSFRSAIIVDNLTLENADRSVIGRKERQMVTGNII